MIEVAVEEVMRIINERSAINKLNFSDIVWTYKGKPLDLPKRLHDGWVLCGLNNIDFITSNYLPDRPWQD